MFRQRYFALIILISFLLSTLNIYLNVHTVKAQTTAPITTTVAVTTSITLTNPAPITTSAVITSPPIILKDTITVSSKISTEQLLLGKMLVILLKNADYTVVDKTGMGDSVAVRAALESGTVDIYPEYTGTSLTVHNGLPVSALPSDQARVYELAKSLDAAKGLIWLAPAKLNDTATLIVRDDLWNKGIKTVTILATYMNANQSPFKVCVAREFYGRTEDGLAGLQKQYGFNFKQNNVLFMALNDSYDGLRASKCDVAQASSTDGRINAWNFHNLDDTLNFFPIDNPAPVIRKTVLDRNPEIAGLLNQLGQYLDNTTMSQLNARVDIGADGVAGTGDEETPEAVAQAFLQSKHLLKPATIVVASKDYTEQLILGKMLALVVKNAGYGVVDKTGAGGSRIVRQAIEKGDVDVYVELTGSSLAVHNALPVDALPSDADKAYALAKSLDERKGLIWLERGPFNDTYAIMVRDDWWNKGIKKLDDLAAYMNKNGAPLTICVENDFFAREHDGLPALEQRYGFTFKQESILLMDLDSAYQGLHDKKCDIAEGFSTDGRGIAWGFHNLTDTLNFFPFYNPAPVVRKAILEANPELKTVLDSFIKLLDNTTMSQLNARVDIGADGVAGTGDEETPEAVAMSFLQSKHLLKPATIVVASKDYTEQLILGKMLALVVKNAGYGVVDKTGAGGSRIVRQAIEKGDVDVYVELTGSSLAVHNALPVDALPSDADKAYALAKSLDERKGLIWLERGPFNDTYAIMVRDDWWNKGIKKLDDLAAYMNKNGAPLTICVENDFFAREHDGLPALEQRYGFTFKQESILLMDLDSAYQGLHDKKCDIAEGFSTDGRGIAWGFHNLTDTLNFFPFYNPAPVVRKAILEANPELKTVLDSFIKLLDNTTMSQLNARVDIGADGVAGTGDEETPEAVAQAFLLKNKLISASTSLSVTTAFSQSTTAAVKASPAITTATTISVTKLLTSPTTVAPTKTVTASPTLTDTKAPTESIPSIVTPEPAKAKATEVMTASVVSEATPALTATVDISDGVLISTPATYSVNARATASTDAPIVQLLPRSNLLSAIGRTADSTWLEVRLADGQSAWLFTAAILAREDAIQALPIVVPPALTQ